MSRDRKSKKRTQAVATPSGNGKGSTKTRRGAESAASSRLETSHGPTKSQSEPARERQKRQRKEEPERDNDYEEDDEKEDDDDEDDDEEEEDDEDDEEEDDEDEFDYESDPRSPVNVFRGREISKAEKEKAAKAEQELARQKEEMMLARQRRLEPLSPLQSRPGATRKGVYLPDWAMAITSSDAEQKLLGMLDYWLGILGKARLESRLKVRANGRFLLIDEQEQFWYVATCREIGWQLHKSKDAVKSLVDKLRDRNFLFAERMTRRDGSATLRLRLNWPEIEAAFGKADSDDDRE